MNELDVDQAVVGAWRKLARAAQRWPQTVRSLPVSREVEPGDLRAQLQQRFTFERAIPLDDLTDQVLKLFSDWNIQVTHPRYFGLFNPSVLPAGVIADGLAAVTNPQLAVWSHAPAANELERLTLSFLAAKLGLPQGSHANFATGGAEANQSAILTALAWRYPDWAERGVRELERRPILYVTAESHHTVAKGCKVAGLGLSSIRQVPVTDSWHFDTEALESAVQQDRLDGFDPLMVVGTAGTTNSGQVDPLESLAKVARRERLWFHVDAAWGGAAVMSDLLRPELAGIELADSVTWDAHKWLSVPMGAGMFFCRHPDAVARAFSIEASYMPPPSGADTVDPFVTTMQWTRRTIGLKVFMTLAALGESGYARLIERQASLGDELRARLVEGGWSVVNDTRLPTVCFTHRDIDSGAVSAHRLAALIQRSGKVWISAVTLGGNRPALRATITSYWSTGSDLDCLMEELEQALAASAGSTA